LEKRIHERIRALLAITVTVIFWGWSYICTKRLLMVFTPFQIAAGRYLIAVLLLVPGGLITQRLRPVSRHDLPRLLVAGFVGICAYFILENFGLRLTTAGMASLIIATIPVINTVVATFFLKQRASFGVWLGVILSVVGVAVVIGGNALSNRSMWGNFLIFAAAITWVGYTLLNQPLSQKYDAFSINTWQAVVGAAFLFVLAMIEGKALPGITVGIMADLLFLAVCCSALGYIFYTYALRHLGSIVVTTFINFMPVLGVLGGVFILGERLTGPQITGGLIIILGVTLVSRKDIFISCR
jgi:drug/metabolite transporter (DMT)-like permease